MGAFLNSVSAVAMIIIMAAAGYIFGKVGWMKSENKKFLSKLIINVGVPCLCVKNMLADITPDMFKDLWLMLLITVLSLLITLALGLLVAKLLKVAHRRLGGFIAMCAFPNTIFVGYPMCIELFGEASVPYIMMFYIVNTIFFWTIGEALIRRSGEKNTKFSLAHTLKGMLTPPLITLFVCLLLMCVNFTLPEFLKTLCGYFSGMVTPLALIYVGFTLYETGFSNLRLGIDMWAVVLIRFVIAPLSMLLLCSIFGVDGLGRGVFVIESGMPVMIQSVVLCGAVGADDSYNALGMSITSLACIIAVPLLMLLV